MLPAFLLKLTFGVLGASVASAALRHPRSAVGLVVAMGIAGGMSIGSIASDLVLDGLGRTGGRSGFHAYEGLNYVVLAICCAAGGATLLLLARRFARRTD